MQHRSDCSHVEGYARCSSGQIRAIDQVARYDGIMQDVTGREGLGRDVDVLSRSPDDGRIAVRSSSTEANDSARCALRHHRAECSGLRVDRDSALYSVISDCCT